MINIDPLDRVLARAREGLSPSSAQIERIWARVPVNAVSGSEALTSSTAPPGAGHLAMGAAAPSGGWAALRATGASGWLAASLFITSGFAAGYWAHSVVASREAAPSSNATAAVARAGTSGPAPAASVTTAPGSSAVPALSNIESPVATDVLSEPAAPSPPRPAASQRRHKAPPRSRQAGAARELAAAADARTQELMLLERIERALRNGDAPLARALLTEIDQRHPKTRLGEERDAARVMADCVAAAPHADLAAERFIQAHPSSVYASRLRTLCWIP